MNQAGFASFTELSERIPFNMHDAYYENASTEHFWIQWRFETLRQLIHECDLRLGPRTLEVGCGHGVAQVQFESAYEIVVDGCDVNSGALQRPCAARGGRYLYNVLDCREDWRAHYDTVLLLDTLEHVPQPVNFLRAIRFHLGASGYLILNVPAMPMLYSQYDAAQGHIKRYTGTVLRAELAQAGFDVLAIRMWGANLVPFALLRKLMTWGASPEAAMRNGFATTHPWQDRLLRRCWQLERKGLHLPGCGTSIAAVARVSQAWQEDRLEPRGEFTPVSGSSCCASSE